MMNNSIPVVRRVSSRDSTNARHENWPEAKAITMAAKEATPAASVGLNHPV